MGSTNHGIDYFLDKLVANKVTIELKPNHMNELHALGANRIDKFSDFEDLLATYSNRRNKGNETRQAQATLQLAPTQVSLDDQIQDVFMYNVACYVDGTLSLLRPADINNKVHEFKKTLADNLAGSYKKLKLSGVLKDVDEVKKEILSAERQDINTVLVYLCRLLQKNIVYNDKTHIYDANNDSYLLVDKEGLIVTDNTSGFNKVHSSILDKKRDMYAERFKKTENLKKVLVKDLKNIAADLEITLHKVIDNKKISLLKEEIIEKISSVLPLI